MNINAVANRRQSIIARAVVILGLLLLLACQDKLPVGPSDPMTGIVIFEHADYLGASAHVSEDIEHLEGFKGPCREFVSGGTFKEDWDDCISSVRVAPGWRATLFRDGDFDGDHVTVTEDVHNLTLVAGDCDKGGFNDCVTSIRVFRP